MQSSWWRWLLSIWIVVFTASNIWAIVSVRNQNDKTRQLIVKVDQASNEARIASCRQGRQDLIDLLDLVTSKSRPNFTSEQLRQFNALLERFSPSRCK